LREFCAAKQVRAEPPEMSTHKPTQFAPRLFVRKGDLQIARCETPISPGKYPRANAEEFPKDKEKWQWQRGGNG
jgi:hypothetical protein